MENTSIEYHQKELKRYNELPLPNDPLHIQSRQERIRFHTEEISRLESLIRYKVFKVGRKSCRKTTLHKNLTREEAIRIVNSYPNSTRSMVCFTKQ